MAVTAPNLGPTMRLASKRVHRVGFGAMQLPGPGVFGPPTGEAQAMAVLRRVADVGVDHIDTAQFYGPDVANRLLREVLWPYPQAICMVSKVGARRDRSGGWLPAQEPAELRMDVETNLQALGVEQIDIVNLRRHEDSSVALEDQLAEMVAMRDQGMIGAIGLSNVTLDQLDAALALTAVACVQNAYNVLDRTSEPVLRRCEQRQIAFVPFFPLGSAFRRPNPVLTHPAVIQAARHQGITASQVALAWALAHSPAIALIPGTSSLSHLEENLAVGGIALDPGLMASLEALSVAP